MNTSLKTTLSDNVENAVILPLKEYLDNIFAGDLSAQTELYNNWYKILFSYFMRRLRNRENTLDCISDTFAKMYNSEALIEVGSVFEKYLYRVANTVLLDYVRKHKNNTISLDNEENGVLQELAISSLTAEHLAKQSLLQKQISNTFSDMNESDAEILRLRLLEELEYEEISSILKLGIDATRKAYSRALKKFESAYLARYGTYE